MKKKFSQRSSTTQRDADRERLREMGDDFIRQDIQQLIRDVAEPRDAEIARLRAKCVRWQAEIAQLRELASQLGHNVMAGESSESSERKICPIAETREEAKLSRARFTCGVDCGEDGDANGELAKLSCGHHVHIDCLMMLLIVQKKTLCPVCRAPMAL